MHTIKAMDVASSELADLDGLSVAQLKAMLQEKHAQLMAKDALLLSYTQQLEAMQLQLLKLRQMQFGKRSEKRAQEIEQLELWVEQLEAVTAQRSCELAARAGAQSTAPVTKPRREFGLHLPRQTQMIAPHDANCPMSLTRFPGHTYSVGEEPAHEVPWERNIDHSARSSSRTRFVA